MKIEGNVVNKKRILTGLYGFDVAFENQRGEIGFPLGTGVELYGPNHCGKSTIAYSLSGLLAHELDVNIALADFEGFDPAFVEAVLTNSQFDNTLYCIQEKDDEKALDRLVTYLDKPEYGMGILDSIGSISPISEATGKLGDANMGRRAFLLAQFTRKMMKILRDAGGDEKVIWMINHAYPIIGGRGMDTPGGEVKKYLASVRLSVKRRFYKNKYDKFPDGSYLIEGTVIKNRWGFIDRKFLLFVLAGKGIHLGVTAMFDAIELGLVDRGRVVKIGDTSYGFLKNIFDEAQAGNDEFFNPFFEIIKNHTFQKNEEENNETNEGEDTPEGESNIETGDEDS